MVATRPISHPKTSDDAPCQSPIKAWQREWLQGTCGSPRESSLALARVAPDHLADPRKGKQGAVHGPLRLPNHEADSKGKIQTLQDPHDADQHHAEANEAADDPHDDVEEIPHGLRPQYEKWLIMPGIGAWLPQG